METQWIDGFERKPVIAFVGHGRAGKDTCAEWMAANTSLVYRGGCSWTILPWIAEQLGLSLEEAWTTRHQHRDEWYSLCNEYRKHDPARLVRDCLEHSDIVCGVRDRVELAAARDEGLLDLIVWVDRDVPVDKTTTFTADDCDLIIPNRGSLDQLYDRLRRFAKTIGVLSAAPEGESLTCETV